MYLWDDSRNMLLESRWWELHAFCFSYHFSEFGPTCHFRCKNPGSSAGEGVMCCWKITQMNDVYRQQPFSLWGHPIPDICPFSHTVCVCCHCCVSLPWVLMYCEYLYCMCSQPHVCLSPLFPPNLLPSILPCLSLPSIPTFLSLPTPLPFPILHFSGNHISLQCLWPCLPAQCRHGLTR